MRLDIYTPEMTLFSGETDSITLPGSSGAFTVWENHAPMISSLRKGEIAFTTGGESRTVAINGGFVEVLNNAVTVCVETSPENREEAAAETNAKQ
jgi:F-type H+-transporting ATPase subunit epsilon